MYKVLFVASEAHPLAKTGGLGDVAGSLPPALKAIGHDVRLLLPAYPSAKRTAESLHPIAQIPIPFTSSPATLLEGFLPGSKIITWLVDYPPAFDRDGHPYMDVQGQSWPDNAQRFALFCHVAVALALGQAKINWRPDVVHCNDWQAGLVPALLRSHDNSPASIFTIHNLAYQGLFSSDTFVSLGLPPALWSMHGLEFYGQLSFMKGGLAFADRLTTVSPTYAREIQTPEFGYGLDGLLRARAARLSGILNGIDTDEWNPTVDRFLPQRYSLNSLADKAVNKTTLQNTFGLPAEAECPVIGMIGRLVEQKGFDLALGAWPELAAEGAQLIVLGSGEQWYENAWREMQQRYPRQVAVRIGYDERLAHHIEAGADMFLMPSRFEPCGLNQMYSLRYGTIPIVRYVGGLADTVIDASPSAIEDGSATGIVFHDANVGALTHAVQRALALYKDKITWQALVRRGMQQNFSWHKSAEEYVMRYREALEDRRNESAHA